MSAFGATDTYIEGHLGESLEEILVARDRSLFAFFTTIFHETPPFDGLVNLMRAFQHLVSQKAWRGGPFK